MSDDIKRVRSPNYPSISLKDAIGHLDALWSKMHAHAAPRDLVLKAMGYSSYNGASGSALSAQVKYGLLERVGDDYKLTERAKQILHPHSPDERVSAIRAAANAPPLFTELLDQFGGTAPPSDDILRSYLARRGFASSAVPSVIQSFRETIDLVSRETARYDSVQTPEPREEPVRAEPVQPSMAPQTLHAIPHVAHHASLDEGEREFAHGPLSRETSYRLLVKGGVGPREIAKLIKYLELQKSILSDDDDPNDE